MKTALHFADEILNQTSLATTTTTETPNKITTIQGHSSSPELTSEQPSTLLVYQTTSIPGEAMENRVAFVDDILTLS